MKRILLLFLLVFSIGSAFGQATLPLSRTAWGSAPTGWTDNGTQRSSNFACSGNDGGSVQSNGKYYRVFFNGTPDKLTYSLKGSNPSTGSFKVQESANGTTWTDVVSYTNITGSACVNETKTLLSTSRYVQFILITKTSGNVDIDDISITEVAGPTVTASPTSLSGFTYVVGNGPSAFQTFTISGSNLTAGITVTPPASYVISKTETGTYDSVPLVYNSAIGTIATTTVYAKLKAGLAVGSYNNEVVNVTSTSATTKTVTLNGSVTAAIPKMNVKGGTVTIISGTTTTATAAGTDFGATAINTTITKTFTIENTGSADLVLTNPAVVLFNTTSPFSVTQPSVNTIAPGANTTFTVSFNSATGGTFDNSVLIGSNDNNTASAYDFAIKAIATDMPPNPTGTISGTTPACSSSTLTYTGTIPADQTYYWQTTALGTSTANSAATPLNATATGNYYVRAFRSGSWSAASTAAYALVVNVPITITTPPSTAATSMCVGTAFVALTVAVTGTTPTYQWYKSTDSSNNTPGDDTTVGSNSSSFTPPNTVAGTSYYYVIVSGASPCTPVKSAISGAITVNPKPATPQGTISPASSCGSTNLTYNYAPGESTDGNTYYWQAAASGTATTDPVATAVITQTATGTRYIRSRNASGCWSDAYSQSINVNAQPVVTTVLVDATGAVGGAASFTIGGTNFSTYTKQWQESVDGGLNWTNVGTNTLTHTVSNLTLSQSGYRYKVIIDNSGCSIESNVAVLTVNNAAPNNGLSLAACLGETEVTLNWTASTGANVPTGYIVFALPNTAVPQMAANVAGNAGNYTANANYTLAQTYTTLGKAVFKGNATSATITGLTNASQYTFKVVAYRGETQTGWAAGINAPGSFNQTYTIDTPNVTNVAATVAQNSSSISWNVVPSSAGCYEYLVAANQGPVTFVPSGDGSAYTPNTVYAGGNQVIFKGTSNSTSISGLTEGISYCYKVFVRKGTQWSEGVAVCATTGLSYCTSDGTNADASGITSVTFNTINQTSVATGGYSDYTNITTTVELGESYPLSVKVNTDGNFTTYTRVWIDWNRNGTFDATELYETGSATNVANGLTSNPLTVNVPTDAVIGNVRMRVSGKSVSGQTTPTACESFLFGEVEDYTIIVKRPERPEIAVKGNNIVIQSGSTATVALNNTLFGIQELTTPSTAKEYIIHSIGTEQLNLTGTPIVEILGVNASEFSVSEQPAITAVPAAGGNTAFKIVFTPAAPGLRTATVRISSNDASENPYLFAIQGTGKSPEIDLQGNGVSIPSGSSVVGEANHTSFGKVQVTGGLATRTFTILNTGTDVLTLTNPVISGSSDFTVTANPAATVAVSGSTTFTITFNPAVVGEKNAIVVIGNNDFNENPYTFAIQGFGVDFIECVFGTEEIVAQQNFEDSPATPVWSFVTPPASTYSITGGNATANGSSPAYITAKSFQVYGQETVLKFDAVNTSEMSDVNLSFRLAAFSRVTTTNGVDIGDNVKVEVSTDGTNWSREIQINGYDNARWSFGATQTVSSKVYTGTNTAQIFQPTQGGNDTSPAYGTINLTNLPKVQNLHVRIILLSDVVNELWAVDNVVLKAKRKASKTWNGANWLNAAGAVSTAPTSSEIAIINGYYTTASGNLSGCKCEIKAGGEVAVIAATFMEIQSDIQNSGIITVLDKGSLVQRDDAASNIGQIIMKRDAMPMYRYDYTYWSTPVTPQTFGALSPNTLADKYFRWNSQFQDWINVLRTDFMAKGNGYIIRAPQTFTPNPIGTREIFTGIFTGIANNGVVNVPVVGGPVGQKLNLLGNPYPSAIYADAFLDNTVNPDLDGTIYVWTHNTPLDPVPNEYGFYSYADNDYAVYNAVGGTSTEQSAVVYNGHIAAGQAFFVKGKADGTATFNNGMRETTHNNQFLRSATTVEKSRIWLNITDSRNAFKQTLVGYLNGASNGLDRNFDGELMGGNATTIYTIVSQKNLTIQGRALPFMESDIVDLGYKISTAGTFKISLANFDGLFTDQNIYLEDKTLNIIHDLKQSPYEFTSAVGTFNTRFVLRYTSGMLSNPDFDTIKNNVTAGANCKTIFVKSSLENIQRITVYDLLGRSVYDNKKVNANQFTINDVVANQQTLVVKIYLENGHEVSKKVIVN